MKRAYDCFAPTSAGRRDVRIVGNASFGKFDSHQNSKLVNCMLKI
jgi:hypothetical protein